MITYTFLIFNLTLTLSYSFLNLEGLTPSKIPINDLIQNIENHEIDQLYITNDFRNIYSKTIYKNNKEEKIITETMSDQHLSDKIMDLSIKNKIYTSIIEKPVNPIFGFFNNALSTVEPFFSFFIFYVIIRSFFQMSTFMPSNNFSKNDDKINIIKSNNISLSSWAGSREIFEECSEIISYLKNDTLYKNVGAEIPKGILLEGPPGTGKTLLAKAIASESNATFISVAASEFIEMFIGLGALKVRNLFKSARDNKPSIIFIDEIDSIGRQRGIGVNMGNDEREQTLNQLLAEMDGFNSNDGIIVLAATNRKDILDSALLRPGRFDRILNIPLPDTESRKAILKNYLDKKNIEKDVNPNYLAELTYGFSGAQLKNLINEAAINAARKGMNIISQENIEDALEKFVVGIIKKNDTRTEDAKLRVSIHEIGHALLAATFKNYFELQKVTIQPTYEGAGGFTLFKEHSNITESGLYTKDMLNKKLIVSLGGKAAEYVFYGNNYISLGAMQDLKQANKLARQMIGNYGMGNELIVFYNEINQNPEYSDLIKEKIDTESLELLNKAYEDAVNIIKDNKDKIINLVNLLLENRSLKGDIFYNFL